MALPRSCSSQKIARGGLRELPAGTCIVACLGVISTVCPLVSSWLIDERDTAGRFEPWRPFTGHLVHGSLTHLLLNLAVFVPVASRRERKTGTARLLLELLALAAAVSLGVRAPHVEWNTYCGLSGVVYGLLTIVLLDGVRLPGAGARTRGGAAVVAVLAMKTALEAAAGGWFLQREGLEASLGVIYLPGSHAAGMAGGLLIAAGSRLQAWLALHPSRNVFTACPGAGESRMAPIIAAPAAPACRMTAACRGSIPPSA
jgi:rhomboid family GlyGly-CTERM serine protease